MKKKKYLLKINKKIFYNIFNITKILRNILNLSINTIFDIVLQVDKLLKVF